MFLHQNWKRLKMDNKYKIVLGRAEIENLAKAVDANNPKFELNFVYVDNESVVSTNTKVLISIKHEQNFDGKLFIHGSILKKALSDRRASYFYLGLNSVASASGMEISNSNIIMEYSVPLADENIYWKYPDYRRILPNTDKMKAVEFVENSNLSGIFAINKIHIDPKLLPTFKKGFVYHDGNNPVLISDFDYPNRVCVIMPIVDSFKEFN